MTPPNAALLCRRSDLQVRRPARSMALLQTLTPLNYACWDTGKFCNLIKKGCFVECHQQFTSQGLESSSSSLNSRT